MLYPFIPTTAKRIQWIYLPSRSRVHEAGMHIGISRKYRSGPRKLRANLININKNGRYFHHVHHTRSSDGLRLGSHCATRIYGSYLANPHCYCFIDLRGCIHNHFQHGLPDAGLLRP